MLTYINDEYEDEMGQPLPIDPTIIGLCQKYKLTAQEEVSFKDVPGGTESFEAWAFQHHVPGNHAVQLVNQKRFLDLYMLQKSMEQSQVQPPTTGSEPFEDDDDEDEEIMMDDQGLLTTNDLPDVLAGDEQAMAESAALSTSSLPSEDLPENDEPTDDPFGDDGLPEPNDTVDEPVQAEINQQNKQNDDKTDTESSQFDGNAFFDSLPESQSVGVLNVTRKLKAVKNHVVKLDDVSYALMISSLKYLINDARVDQLIDTVTYSDIHLTYIMYMATITKQITVKDWRDWCVAKVVSKITTSTPVMEKFKAHQTIDDVINDTNSDTKLSDSVRWFMLMSTITPTVISSETIDPQDSAKARLDNKLTQLQNELWLSNALTTAILASEDVDPSNWPELLSGERMKKLRYKISQLRTDLIKPYSTMMRTEAMRRH